MTVCLILAGGNAVFAGGPTEYPVKAAFIYNIARLVEWPAEVTATTGKPYLTICLYGKNLFGKALNKYKSKRVRKRPVKLLRNIRLSKVSQCHLLFISRLEEDNLPAILAALEHLPILTVGDMDNFIERGGMINMVTRKDNKLAIEINQKAAEEAGLKISGRLLILAKKLVKTETAEKGD
ncbi:MAG: YfiR family protein [Gammaproteobacteria bacterium]|nr:YfiR family protein [Gammaproteobacteria bacterium]